jgi:hypothetical protein
MSTGVQPPTPPDASVPTSPSTAPTTSPAAPEWRAPATAPAWAAGKTADEVLGIAGQMEQTLQRFVAGNQPAPAPAAPAPAPAQGFADDDYVSGAQFRAAAPQFVQQYVQPQMAQLQASIAQTNLETVRRDPKCAEIFDKWGPEVYNKLASVDKSHWNVDNLRVIVNLVKADHVDEIANERASRLATERMETFRSSGVGLPSVPATSPQYTLQSEQLPAAYRERLAKVGLTEPQLDEFCRANGMTREQFFADVAKTVVANG